MRNIMYLRPGNLFKEFYVEESAVRIKDNGRAVQEYTLKEDVVINGCLAAATAKEIARFAQPEHPITHTIVEYARPKAKPDDRLHLGERTFLIYAVDEPGSLGVCTI